MMNNVPAYFEGALSFRLSDLDPQQRVKKWVLRLWNAYWDRQARRATAVMLHVLSDRTLADIGVSRSEIESLVNRRTRDRRRRYLRQSRLRPSARSASSLRACARTRH